jgi:hypothetical protein
MVGPYSPRWEEEGKVREQELCRPECRARVIDGHGS